tara:strand:- start:1215 stop:2063 length:849 start_codon:yes stop_codon:yes gene_type:complete
VNADDFGLTGDVTRGILAAHRNGQVSSTTLMVNTPGTEEAVEAASDHPNLGIGLHFNLTEGRPLTDAPSLVDGDGRFLLRGELLGRAFRRQIDPDDVARELDAQLSRFHDLGLTPTHMDSHQHVHMAPPIFRAMGPVLRGQVHRLRVARPPRPGSIGGSGVRSRIRNTFMTLAASNIRRHFSGATNDRLVSLHLLPTEQDWVTEDYARVVDQTGPADLVEVMVHPFAPGPDLSDMYRHDPIREIRMDFARTCWTEFEILTTSTAFDPGQFHLISWDAVQPTA